MYAVKEVFYTLQGEGHHAGAPAIFVRFAGCNLWSGREQDRTHDTVKGNCAAWCDTDFRGTDGVNGGRYTPGELATIVERLWPSVVGRRVVLTGGEPLLQADKALVDALHRHGFAVHVETNGTLPLPCWIDWVTASPKPPSAPLAQHYDEVKVVTDGTEDVSRWRSLAAIGFIQPKWVADPVARHLIESRCVEYVKANPTWRLGIQMHKYLSIDPEVPHDP
jgi:7-carboxy-7-deazaguanine synthase (Cx14CxxC type)